MSKPGGDLRKKRRPNQQENFEKRDVQTRRRSSEKVVSKPAGDLPEKETSKPTGELQIERSPNQQENFEKRDVQNRRRSSTPCPSIPTPEDSSYCYFPPIYAWVFQVVSFRQNSPSKPCIHLSCPPYVLHAPPIPFS